MHALFIYLFIYLLLQSSFRYENLTHKICEIIFFLYFFYTKKLTRVYSLKEQI